MLELQHIVSSQGPKRVGPFSHAVRAGDFLFVTGQMPTLPEDPNTLVAGGIEEQTKRVMDNLKLVLSSQSLGFDRIAFARVYLVNFQDFDRMNKVYQSFFPKDRLPSRTCIGVTGLAVGALVEIDFVVAC
ncbi:MAG: enamine deaminase RidA [Rhodospirillaceae bacterium]|nr:enamine deaminase RidA [Rhodospirillaceae bacterium]|tara:strand:+ start:161 stop:550 length:390 start_codon:yes stop_codon:yes gene_type:complete